MNFGLYEWVYIITDIFGIYTVYKFMSVFFERKKSDRKIELLTYLIYFLFISAIYLFINIPVILMLCNLICLIGITCNYDSTIKKRILSVVFIYLIFFCVETTVGLISGYFDFSIFSANNYSSIYGLILFRILSYAVVLVFNNYKNIKRGETVPSSNWFSILLIPASSLYIILVLFQADGLSIIQVIASVILLFLINFATFQLYDAITAALSEKINSILAMEQNRYYYNQFELMKASLDTTRAIKHDLKNHMLSISSLVNKGEKEETLNYIAEIMSSFNAGQNYASSGNIIIDSIINFKLQEAEQKEIVPELDLNIPEKIDIPSFDMTIILGNLLDNAINAASGAIGEKNINIVIKYDKGRLFLRIDNPYEGEIYEDKGRLLTTKTEKDNHGIGLNSVRKTVQKYSGILNIEYNHNIFSVTVLMYI